MAKRLTMTYKDEVTTYDPIDVYNNSYSQINFQNVLKKLAHYEDLEEQGRLIILPCVPNETVWCADEYNTRPVLYSSKSSILYDIECVKGIGYTKEEAEAKLKERSEQE